MATVRRHVSWSDVDWLSGVSEDSPTSIVFLPGGRGCAVACPHVNPDRDRDDITDIVVVSPKSSVTLLARLETGVCGLSLEFTLDLADRHAKLVQRDPTTFAPFIKPETSANPRSSHRVNYPNQTKEYNYFEKKSTQKLLYPSGIAAMEHGWCMATDALCDPQFVRIISPNGVVTTCGQGRAAFSNGFGQAACFNEPLAIAALTDGVSCVVSERGRRSSGLRVVTTGCVASTLAGTGAEGNQDGAFDTATFTDLFSVAVDINNKVVAVDVGKGEICLTSGVNNRLQRTRLRVLDQSTKLVTTLQAKRVSEGGQGGHCVDAEAGEGATQSSPLLLPSYPHITIDDCGSIWCAHTEGVDIITGAGLNKGHHAWSNLMWEPTAICHSFQCTPKAKEAVYTILAICARTFVETTPQDRETVWLLPELPIEVWHYILSMIQISKLGVPRTSHVDLPKVKFK